MPLYESVFIVRQDVSSVDLDKITEDFSAIIKNNKGDLVKKEYWGLRSLAYEINNNRKGHYTFFGINASDAAIKEMERKMKYSIDVIRFMTLKVDEISKDPSPILKEGDSDSEETVDVTVSKS